jgi:ribose 5-phosphate isomerase RpiB
MKKIIIRVDENGFVLGAFVSPELEDALIELIDYCTDDTDRLNAAKEDNAVACQAVKNGDLVWLPA